MSDSRELLAERSLGGAYHPDGTPARDTFFLPGNMTLDMGLSLVKPSDEGVTAVCSEEVAWAGGISSHFGHFFTESISRLWPLLPGGQLEGLPAIFTTPRPFPYVAEWMEAFGLRTVDLPEHGAVRFTKMFVPEMAWRLNAWIAPEVRDINLHARNGMDVPPLPDHDVLWLSRAGLARERVAYDEVLLEWLLGERILSIRPETLTLAEQVAALEGSRAVAGVIGSAFHTLLMTEKTPECLYLCPDWLKDSFPAQHWLLDASATFAPAIVFPTEDRRARRRLARMRRNFFPNGYRISIPDALRALGDTVLPGLLEDPRLAAFASPERRGSAPGNPALESGLDDAVFDVLADPLSVGARRKLATAFETAGVEGCANEQRGMVDDLTERA